MSLSEDDLAAMAAEHLVQCGPHDYGLIEYGCNCPTVDPRSTISRLIDEVRRLRAEPDGETRVEWGTRWQDGTVSKPMSEESARHWVAADRSRRVAAEETTLVRRIVHTGPWTEVAS